MDVSDDELVGHVCQNLGVLANMQGKLREARIHYLESIGSCVRSGNKRNELTAYNNLGFVCGELGEWMEAEVYFDRAVEIAERIGDSAHIASVLANRSLPLIHVGELARARDTLRRAGEAARRHDRRRPRGDRARPRGGAPRCPGGGRCGAPGPPADGRGGPGAAWTAAWPWRTSLGCGACWRARRGK